MQRILLYIMFVVYLSINLILGGCEEVNHLKQLVTDDKELKIHLESVDSTLYKDLKGIFPYVEKVNSPVFATASNDKILLYQVFGIDGDTLQASISKADLLAHGIPDEMLKDVAGDYIEIKVRYLLIDTPESVHPTKEKQHYSKEAASRNMELLMQNQVSIMFDSGDKVDDYGRLLAYVFIGDDLLQEILVREGYARVGYIFPPNTSKLKVLQEAEKSAQIDKLRIWSIPNYVTPTGFQE